MQLNIFLGYMGPWQIGLIVFTIILLFGARKIPELFKGLGSGIKEFRNATKDKFPEDSSKVNDH